MESWPSDVPGSRSSAPVEMITTRGRGRDSTWERPTEANRPSCRGPSTVPSSSSTSPTEHGAVLEQYVADLHVLALVTHMLVALRRLSDPDRRDATVSPLDGDD